MTALEIAKAVRAGERSARSVVEEHLASIDAREAEIHAFNLVTAEAALARAGVSRNDRFEILSELTATPRDASRSTPAERDAGQLAAALKRLNDCMTPA